MNKETSRNETNETNETEEHPKIKPVLSQSCLTNLTFDSENCASNVNK